MQRHSIAGNVVTHARWRHGGAIRFGGAYHAGFGSDSASFSHDGAVWRRRGHEIGLLVAPIRGHDLLLAFGEAAISQTQTTRRILMKGDEGNEMK